MADDIVTRLGRIHRPICPVCHEDVLKGGCIHMADEALEIWEARRG